MPEAANSGLQRDAKRSPDTVAHDLSEAQGPLPDSVLEQFPYPLDPPLVDVRIPVQAPHIAATRYSYITLKHHFPKAEVGADLHILFSEPGRAEQSRLAPDVLVALNVPRSPTRGDFDVDALGAPDFVLEVLSHYTWRHDLGRKLDCYQHIGVRECLLFDVTGEDVASTGAELWGFALTPNSRRPLENELLPNGEMGVHSEVLGLWAYVAKRVPPVAENETWALAMRWHDPMTGASLQDTEEVFAGQEAQRNRAEAAERRAEAARVRGDAAKARAEAARARADAAERRVAELEAQLRALGRET